MITREAWAARVRKVLNELFMENNNELKANEYKCYQCGNIYEFGWTDEEARAEADRNFKKEDQIDMQIVCDYCYKSIFN